MAIQNAVTPLVDWEVDHFSDSPPAGLAVDHFAVLPPEDSVVVQVYSRAVDSQELVWCPGPTRLLASTERRKTKLLITETA